MTRCASLRLERVLFVLVLLGGAAACGSGNSGSTTVPTSSPGINVTLTAKAYELGANVNVVGLTNGADGNIWFSECPDSNGVGAVARLTTAARLTVYPLPDGTVACPKWLTLGIDRAVWFTEQSLGAHPLTQPRIGRADATGNVTEFALPSTDNEPSGIVLGSDGNIWYDVAVSNGASTVATVRGFSSVTHSIVGSITLAPSVALSGQNNTMSANPTDGAVIVASGSVTRVVPGASPRASQPLGIPAGRVCSFTAAGKDGNLYLQCSASLLAQASQATYYTVYLPEAKSIALTSGLTPVGFSGPMAFGSDGYLYLWGTLGTPPAPTAFAMSTTGFIQAYYVDANVQDRPVDAVLGADGAMWFTVSNGTRGIILRVPPYQTTSPY